MEGDFSPCSSPQPPAPIPASQPIYFWSNHSKFHQITLKELINAQGKKHFCSELQPGNSSAFPATTLISAPAPGSSCSSPTTVKHFLFRVWAVLRIPFHCLGFIGNGAHHLAQPCLPSSTSLQLQLNCSLMSLPSNYQLQMKRENTEIQN